MRGRFFSTIFVYLFCFAAVRLFGADAPTENRHATVLIFADAGEQPVSEVEFEQRKVLVLHWDGAPAGYVGRVVLAGHYHRIGWKLFVQKQPLPATADGRFTVSFALHQRGARILLEARGPAGQRERETVQVVAGDEPPVDKKREVPLAEDVVVAAPGSEPVTSEQQRRWHPRADLALRSVGFSQPDLIDASQLWLALRGALAYEIEPRRWEAVAVTSIDALALRRTPDDVSLRLFEASLTGFRVWTVSENDWQLRVGAGARFVTSFVEPGDFGPQYLVAPQVNVSIGGPVFGQHRASLFTEAAPLFASDTHGFNRYFAVGLDYAFAHNITAHRWHCWLRWDTYSVTHTQGEFLLHRSSLGVGFEW